MLLAKSIKLETRMGTMRVLMKARAATRMR